MAPAGGRAASTHSHLLVLAAYFVIRPIRDHMGLVGGTRNLAWLFTGLFAVMILNVRAGTRVRDRILQGGGYGQ
jgi:hypothetical protein